MPVTLAWEQSSRVKIYLHCHKIRMPYEVALQYSVSISGRIYSPMPCINPMRISEGQLRNIYKSFSKQYNLSLHKICRIWQNAQAFRVILTLCSSARELSIFIHKTHSLPAYLIWQLPAIVLSSQFVFGIVCRSICRFVCRSYIKDIPSSEHVHVGNVTHRRACSRTKLLSTGGQTAIYFILTKFTRTNITRLLPIFA